MCTLHTLDSIPQVHVTDPHSFNPLRLALSILISARKLYPTHFRWRADMGRHWADMLLGTDAVRKGIDEGRSVDEIEAMWQEDLVWFRALREKYLLYK